MGGTTAKASIIERGAIALSAEYEVGGGLNQGSRLIGAADISSGSPRSTWRRSARAGDPSLDRRRRVLRVGPESAGAVPGPACYGRGGERPTVTDANLVLGYLNPGYLVGGELRLDAARAERALQDVAAPLGFLLDAAEGVHRIANAAMQRAIRSVSIERGRDPRDFTLVAFGGSGPVHAAGLAEALDIGRILIPPHPGLFSAIGLLTADVQQLYTRSLLRELGEADLGAAETIFREMEARAVHDLGDEGFRHRRCEARALRRPPLSQADLRADAAAARARARAGRSRAARRGLPPRARSHLRLRHARRADRDRLAQAPGARRARVRAAGVGPRIGPDGGVATAGGERLAHSAASAARSRRASSGAKRSATGRWQGPLVIEEYDSMTVVPPLDRPPRRARIRSPERAA